MILKASIEIEAVVVVSLLTKITPPSSALYSNNLHIALQICNFTLTNCLIVSDCTVIVDSNTNPESNCGGLFGNSISISKVDNSQLGIN